SPLVTQFAERVAALGELDDGERAELVAAARRAVAQVVWPAWERLRALVPELMAKAPEAVGAWALPEGSLYYGWALRYHTTTDLDADTIHELGLREVARIHDEMRAILAAEGHWPPRRRSDEEGAKEEAAPPGSSEVAAPRGLAPAADAD